MRTIYRVQCPTTGKGPYTAHQRTRLHGGYLADINSWHSNCDETPSPSNYGEPWYNRTTPGWRWRFGFESLAALRAWFGDCLDLLEEAGFEVVFATLPDEDVMAGRRQLTYRPPPGTHYARVPWYVVGNNPEVCGNERVRRMNGIIDRAFG